MAIPPSPATPPSTLTSPASAGPLQLRRIDLNHARVDLGLGQARVLARGSWGAGPGQFGRGQDTAGVGPMSLALEADGSLQVLDQVNRRIVRLGSDGARRGSLPLSTETALDLCPAGGVTWLLSYLPGGGRHSHALDRDRRSVA